MSNKTKETLIKIGISLLGFAIGVVAGWLFLDWVSHQANQNKVQTCNDGYYWLDDTKTERVYLQALDTCRLEKK